jgi:hypothetical protein
MLIHLGVVDIPYADASYEKPHSPKARLGRVKRGKIDAPRTPSNQQTTGDVAEVLEAKYHVMEVFADLHEDVIVSAFEESLGDALQSLIQGAPPTMSFSAAAESAIEDRFRQFLSNREMDETATPGVPTKAARDGVSHRFAHPYAKRPSRPSFIDTGLMQANFKVWTTD